MARHPYQRGVPPRHSSGSGTAILAVVAGGLGIIVLAVVMSQPPRRPVAPPKPEPSREVVQPRLPPAAAEAERLLAGAEAHWTAHPDDFAGAIMRFEQVARMTDAGPWPRQAAARVEALKRTRERRMQQIMADLRREAEALSASRDYDGAAAMLRAYGGPLAAETRDAREALAEAFLARKPAAVAPPPEEPDAVSMDAVEALIDTLAARLVARDFRGAGAAFVAARKQPGFADSPVVARLGEVGRAVAAMDRTVADTFRPSIGQAIEVVFKDAERTLQIAAVERDMVMAVDIGRGAGVRVQCNFNARQLALDEILPRLGDDDSTELNTIRGIYALHAGDTSQAAAWLGKVKGAFGDALRRHAGSRLREAAEGAAASALQALLKQAGLVPEDERDLPTADPERVARLLAQLKQRRYPANTGRDLAAAAIDCRNDHGATEIGRAYAPVVQALTELRTGAVPPNVTNGLVMWLTAEEGVEVDEDARVAKWTPARGAGHVAAQERASYRPDYLVPEGGGFPGVSFDGVNDFLEVAANPAMNTGGPYHARTLTAVFRPAKTSGGPQIIFDLGDERRGFNLFVHGRYIYGNAWDFEVRRDRQPWGPAYAGQSIDRREMFVVTVVYSARWGRVDVTCNGRRESTRQHGQRDHQRVGPMFENSDPIYIGRCVGKTYLLDGPGTRGCDFKGVLYELLYYNAALKPQDVLALQKFYGEKYGFRVAGPVIK